MADPLPSWNAGAAKPAIMDFIDRVAAEGGSDYVAPADRIAVVDNDGTLWCAQLYDVAPDDWNQVFPLPNAL
jgi:hypothetical protein